MAARLNCGKKPAEWTIPFKFSLIPPDSAACTLRPASFCPVCLRSIGAAGAVVSKDVAPYIVAGGVAAKPIKRRFTEEQEQALMDISWWDWSHDQLKQRLPDFRALPIDAFIEKYR